MTTFNGYEYNDCGVCVNPEVPYEFGSFKNCYFSISISETPRGWVYGHNQSVNTRGCGRGCWLDKAPAYPTRSKAILSCAERIKEWFGDDKGATKAITELDRIIAEESGKKPHLKQYSIFDYL